MPRSVVRTKPESSRLKAGETSHLPHFPFSLASHGCRIDPEAEFAGIVQVPMACKPNLLVFDDAS
jgi:hypothetical protein